MRKELISKATRNEFRELLVGFTLREIEMIFESGNLKPKLDYIPPVSGQRRGLVEQYYASLDFTSVKDVNALLLAYDEFIEQLRRAQNTSQDPNIQQAIIDGLIRRMNRDGINFIDNCFVLNITKANTIPTDSLIGLSEESINEHIEKAQRKIQSGDNAGAITAAYTLVEQFLKELLRKLDITFNPDEGDIRSLYKIIAPALNLNPSGESLESYLKSILEGLKQQINGLFSLANKASDRHARRYNPAEHHAKLAINCAFCLCEFLLDSYNYQIQKNKIK